MAEDEKTLKQERDQALGDWTDHRDTAWILLASALLVGGVGVLTLISALLFGTSWSGLWLVGLAGVLGYMRRHAVIAREWAYADWLYKAAAVEDEEETARARLEARREARERIERIHRDHLERSGVYTRGHADCRDKETGT